ncbi:MAG: LysM peptidoglycan-binding domain-containing protein, partial [Simkaniaceae bacterium]|nr:LysM peptidoglycan-binding domain-containing protein [Simkaniaceae bacterium]
AHSTPFHLAFTLFSREPWALEENDVFNLLLEGEWAHLEKIATEKDFSNEGRRAILGEYLSAGSKKAMTLLGKPEVKRLENGKLLAIIPKSDDVAFLKDLANGVRSDEVRQAAAARIREITPVTVPKPVIPAGDHRYTVQKGDTLWQIARNHRVPLKKLLADNNMSEKDSIRPGKQLIIKN